MRWFSIGIVLRTSKGVVVEGVVGDAIASCTDERKRACERRESVRREREEGECDIGTDLD